jgi:4-alpha-glucanotransferase
VNGRWVPAPGRELFSALKRGLGSLPIIAEDLGVITPDVEALRDEFGLPGMRILQFAFGNDPKADDYKPANHPANSVAYTGTHDNDTTRGWWLSQAGVGSTRDVREIEQERRAVLALTQSDGTEIHWDMIRLLMGSRASLAIVPLQDVLGLGSEARMNAPGTSAGNWTWRFESDQLPDATRARFRRLAQQAGRLPVG